MKKLLKQCAQLENIALFVYGVTCFQCFFSAGRLIVKIIVAVVVGAGWLTS